MVLWVFAAICHRHLGVINWYRTDAALAFRGGWGAGGEGEPRCQPSARPRFGPRFPHPYREAQIGRWRFVSIPRHTLAFRPPEATP